jgi:hypothetical protein
MPLVLEGSIKLTQRTCTPPHLWLGSALPEAMPADKFSCKPTADQTTIAIWWQTLPIRVIFFAIR